MIDAFSPDGSEDQALSAVPPSVSQRVFTWLSARTSLHAPQSAWHRYGTAALTVLAALGLRLLLDPYLGARVTYGFFLIATAVVGWRCGFGPAMASVVAGVFFGTYLQHRADGSFALDFTPDVISLVVCLIIGTLTAAFLESLRLTAMEYARRYRLAREAEIRKDQFLAMLSHELRNPLVPIRNALYVLETLDRRDSETVELHGIMSTQVNHLVRLVDDLLDVARISHGRIELRSDVVDLGEIVTPAVNAARSLIDERKHSLHVHLPPNSFQVVGDPVRLAQVLTNLLTNAAKYTPDAGRIWLSAERDGDQAVFRIRDTGVGLTAEQIARVFDLFEQADASIDATRGGLGIGLTLSRLLVQLHGGSIEAASPGPGLGSEFTVRIPNQSAVSGAAPISRRLPVDPSIVRDDEAPSVAGRRLRVLVVEDAAAVAQSTAAILRLWRYDVAVAVDGFSGLETARSFLPDVVLCDLGMPRMDGYRFARELRLLPQLSRTVLIAVSGYGQTRDRERSRTAGFEMHLVKPVVPEQLRQVLDSIDRRPTTALP
jgi:signal transduction histidine kinase